MKMKKFIITKKRYTHHEVARIISDIFEQEELGNAHITYDFRRFTQKFAQKKREEMTLQAFWKKR